MSSERAGAPTHGALNREEAIELLSDLLEVAGGTIATSRLDRVLDALEACVVPDPRITRIEALLKRDRMWEHMGQEVMYVDELRSILRGDE